MPEAWFDVTEIVLKHADAVLLCGEGRPRWQRVRDFDDTHLVQLAVGPSDPFAAVLVFDSRSAISKADDVFKSDGAPLMCQGKQAVPDAGGAQSQRIDPA